MMKKRSEETVQEFMGELFSGKPTPGGGGAAAMSGALGVSLAAMVSHLSLNKKKLEAFKAEHEKLLVVFAESKDVFLKLIDEDELAFQKVMQAYKIKVNNEEEAQQKQNEIQKASLVAAKVPLRCLQEAVVAFSSVHRLIEIGNENVFSDIACSFYHLDSCVHSSLVNIAININSHRGLSEVDEILSEVERQKEQYENAKNSFADFLIQYSLFV